MRRCNVMNKIKTVEECCVMVHLMCWAFISTQERVDCGICVWQKIKAACGKDIIRPLFSVGQSNNNVASNFCGAACGVWTASQAWLITLGKDYMSLITCGGNHTHVWTPKGVFPCHSETSRKGQCISDIDIWNEPDQALPAHMVRKEFRIHSS
jgi:hypothetical protein